MCNFFEGNNLVKLCNGIKHNEVVQKIDFSDNNFTDQMAMPILSMIKFMAEKKNNALWRSELRSNTMPTDMKD